MSSPASAAGRALPLPVLVQTVRAPKQQSGGGAAPAFGDAQLVMVDGTSSMREAVIAARNAILRQHADEEARRKAQAQTGQQELALSQQPNNNLGMFTDHIVRRYQSRRNPNFIDNGLHYATKPSQLFARQV